MSGVDSISPVSSLSTVIYYPESSPTATNVPDSGNQAPFFSQSYVTGATSSALFVLQLQQQQTVGSSPPPVAPPPT